MLKLGGGIRKQDPTPRPSPGWLPIAALDSISPLEPGKRVWVPCYKPLLSLLSLQGVKVCKTKGYAHPKLGTLSSKPSSGYLKAHNSFSKQPKPTSNIYVGHS